LFVDADGNVGIGGTTTTGWAQKQVVLDSGSGAAASYVLVNDTTGRTATDGGLLTLSGSDLFLINRESANLIFRTANTERLRIDSSGRLGLGTSSPDQTLDIFGSGTSTSQVAAITLRDSNSVSSRRWCISNGAGGNVANLLGKLVIGYGSTVNANPITGTAAVVIDSSGRVGIGTTSPEASLHVFKGESSGAAANNQSSLVLENSSNTYLQFLTPSANESGILFGDDDNDRGGITYQHSADTLSFRVNASLRATIDSSGRLLVGTSSAEAFSGIVASFQLQGTTTATARQSIFYVANNASGPNLTFAKARTTAKAALSANDELGTISFFGSDGVDNNQRGAEIGAYVDGAVSSNDLPGRLVFSTTADGASSPTERMKLLSTGQLNCIGVYNDTTATAANVFVASSGNILRSTSSAKYKTDIETIQDLYADALLQCRPVWYRSTCPDDNPNWGWWGFIAEEVAAIDPRLVHWKTVEITYDDKGAAVQTPCDPEPEGVQYDRFVPHLLNLIKRQKEQIEAMEARLSALEAS
jgi:hypothetical protein